MNMTQEKKSRFKTVVPVMIYMKPEDKTRLDKFSRKHKVAASQISREGINMRMDENDYNKGFDAGLLEAKKIVSQTEGAKMMFPSGKSFSDLVCEQIDIFMRCGS